MIEVNHNINRYKQKARNLLLSIKTIEHRQQQPADVEAIKIKTQNYIYNSKKVKKLQKTIKERPPQIVFRDGHLLL